MLPKSLTKQPPIPMATPPLVDDVMREIFLRLPPGDPTALVRVAAGCRSWRDILSDAAFARDYREHHGAPPMLGFLYDRSYTDDGPSHEKYWVSHFVSIAPFRPSEYRLHCRVLDSRHGLVLFYTPRMAAEFLVYDLVTGYQWEIRADPGSQHIMRWEDADEDDDEEERIYCNAAVLCAIDRCKHLDCHGGPFRVALVGSVKDGSVSQATVYSSETGEWSDLISVKNPNCIDDMGHSAVVGNKVYVPCLESDSVVEYKMDEQKLSVIDCPLEGMDEQPYIELMGVEDGMLLFASVVKPRLYLWSMEGSPSGTARWARRRVIELEPLLPPDALSDRSVVSAVGFAEGVRVIFLSTVGRLYTIDLNSGEGMLVYEIEIRTDKVMPYMSY